MSQSIRISLILLGVALSLAIFYAWDHIAFKSRTSAILEERGIRPSAAAYDVDILSKSSRYVGTEGHIAAQQYIKTRLSEYLEETQITSYAERVETVIKNRFVEAPVTNIIGFIPANNMSNETKNVALFSHYDSAESSFGANDNAAGVATLLATAEYAAQQNVRNYNLWLVFVDAEEIGLLGSKALKDSGFLENIDYLLNIEARGNSGHSVIFEHIGSDTQLRNFLNLSRVTYTDSLVLDIYKILPNMTDVDELALGLSQNVQLLINTAYFGNGFAYHNEFDGIDALNYQGLLHHITQSLALLDFASLPNTETPVRDDKALFIKTLTKSLSISAPQIVVTRIGLGLFALMLLLAGYQCSIFFQRNQNKPQRVWSLVLKLCSFLLIPIIPTTIIVIVSVILGRVLGDRAALSTLSLLLYVPLLICVISFVYTQIVVRWYGLGLARLGADLLLAIITLLVCLQSHSVITVLVSATLLRTLGIALSFVIPQFSIPILATLVGAFFAYNLHLFEVLIYLGGIKTPLILTALTLVGVSGNIIEIVGRLNHSTAKQRRKDIETTVKPDSIFGSDSMVSRSKH